MPPVISGVFPGQLAGVFAREELAEDIIADDRLDLLHWDWLRK